jgi:hypothetical protein
MSPVVRSVGWDLSKTCGRLVPSLWPARRHGTRSRYLLPL